MSALRIFISHSHHDKVLAVALQALLTDVFGEAVTIDYSSDDAPAGGIRAGGTWLEWIMTTVRHTDVCLVILTEDSASTPWVTWETGAMTGVAMGGEALAGRAAPAIRVVPLIFGIHADRVPAPLQHQQAVRGDEQAGVGKLLFMLHERCGLPQAHATRTDDPSVSQFVKAVREFMERRTREHPLRLQTADLSALHLLNGRQGLTLEPRDGEIANGVRLQCGPFTGDAHQRWYLYAVATDAYKITTLDGTKCLSLQNDSKRPGAAVVLWDYLEHPSQHWHLTSPFGSGGVLSTVTLINAFSDCLLSSAVDTTDVVQARRANKTNEDWWMLIAGRI